MAFDGVGFLILAANGLGVANFLQRLLWTGFDDWGVGMWIVIVVWFCSIAAAIASNWPTAAAAAAAHPYFRVMTWNLMGASDVHHSNGDAIGSWAERRAHIVQQIKGLPAEIRPDIVLFQEVPLQLEGEDQIRKRDESLLHHQMRELGYDGLMHRVTKKRSNCLGNATYWLRDRFNTLSCPTSATLNHASVECQLQWWPERDTRPSAPPYYLYVANVHLRAGLQSQCAERVHQMKKVLGRVKSNCDMMKGDHCIIGGDFNDELKPCVDAGDGRDLYNLLLTAGDYSGASSEPTYCSPFGRYWTFDHVLVSRGLQQLNLSSASPHPLPDKIPNERCPSDHFPVIATLSLLS